MSRISDERLAKKHESLTEQIRLLRIRLGKTAISEDAAQYSELLSEAEFKLALITELRERRAQAVTVNLYGPHGWINGLRGLSEDSWELESDPLENSDEYFAIPLYALTDPFAEIGKTGPTLASPPPAQSADAAKVVLPEVVAWVDPERIETLHARKRWATVILEPAITDIATMPLYAAPASGGVSEEVIQKACDAVATAGILNYEAEIIAIQQAIRAALTQPAGKE